MQCMQAHAHRRGSWRSGGGPPSYHRGVYGSLSPSSGASYLGTRHTCPVLNPLAVGLGPHHCRIRAFDLGPWSPLVGGCSVCSCNSFSQHHISCTDLSAAQFQFNWQLGSALNTAILLAQRQARAEHCYLESLFSAQLHAPAHMHAACRHKIAAHARLSLELGLSSIERPSLR